MMPLERKTVTSYQNLIYALLCIAGLLVSAPARSLAPPPAVDDFTRGWLAYDSGHFEDALRIWIPLAEAGDVNAQTNLGVMYDQGKGVALDVKQATTWYRAAADQDNANAQFNLALMYAEGRGIKQDYQHAAHWYHKAAQNGIAVAQFNLGMLYSEGLGVEQDQAQAFHWLHQAAGENLPGAQFNLAALYASQENDTAHQRKALEWYYQAGLSYLQQNDQQAVQLSIDSIRRLAPGHSFASELEELADTVNSGKHHEAALAPANGFSAGTAWPVARGYAVTNNHVVADVSEVALLNVKGEQIAATVVLRDEANDIALLSVEDPDTLPPALPLANTRVRLGAAVFTIGYPRIDIMGRTPKLTDGIISSMNGLRDDPATLQISVPVQPGNSGGPLLNMNGEVVGVVASMLGATDTATGATRLLPNVNYAIKIEILQDLLPLLPDKQNGLQELSSQSDSLADLADRIQESVMIVMGW